MKLSIYHRDNTNEAIEQFIELIIDRDLDFFASDLLRFGIRDMQQVESAVVRAIQICKTAHISIRRNFKSVVLSDHGIAAMDWKLSPLARKLVVLNADASNPLVARAQLELIEKQMRYVKV